MRKRVIRREQFGSSPATKVVYDDGTYGLEMNGGSGISDSVAFRPQDTYQSDLQALDQRGLLERGETPSPQQVALYKKYADKFQGDFLDKYVSPQSHRDLQHELGVLVDASMEDDPTDERRMQSNYDDMLQAYLDSANEGTPGYRSKTKRVVPTEEY